MVTLTQSVLDLAGWRTAVGHLGSSQQTALPLGQAELWEALQRNSSTRPISLAELTGKKGEMVSRVHAGYRNEEYWFRLFRSRDVETFAGHCWNMAVPLEAEIGPRLAIEGRMDGSGVRLSPQPRVLIFPFGWSFQVSVLVRGKHSLEDLARISTSLSTESAFRLLDGGPAEPLTFDELAEVISRGVRADIFLGTKTGDSDPQEMLSVVTVLEKSGGGPPLRGLVREVAAPLAALLRPKGTLGKPLLDCAQSLPRGVNPDLNYVLLMGSRCFIWAEHLLQPEGRNLSHLRCYHSNTFRALLQVRHAHLLLERFVELEDHSPELSDLAQHACDFLDPNNPIARRYRCRASVSFRERVEPDVRRIIAKARKLLGKDA